MEQHYSNCISALWSLIGLATVLRSLVPPHVVDFVIAVLHSWLGRAPANGVFRVPQFRDDNAFQENLLYTRVSVYVGSLGSTLNDTHSADLLCSSNDDDEDDSCSSSTSVIVRLGAGQTVHDQFMGHAVSWTHESMDKPVGAHSHGGLAGSVSRSFVLRMPPEKHKKQRAQLLLMSYLEHVQKRAQELQQHSRELRLFTNGDPFSGELWKSVPFRHPATFQSVALEPQLKRRIMEDLDAFVAAKEYYHKLGRAWKRGYLLYGPPGTGKSSTVAAMANYLRYDVYDLELTKVDDNSQLRNLLMQTSNRSILLIEDIDCSINLSNRAAAVPYQCGHDENINGTAAAASSSSKVTLSGMLNFIDGLWSCCGEQRVIVFTTNNKDKLDPALLRPGRMDLHLYLGYCTFSVFLELACNYISSKVKEHPMLPAVEAAFADEASMAVTPAQMAEIMLSHRNSADAALEAVVAALLQQQRPCS